MTLPQTNKRRLCVWAETPDQRHFIQSRLPKYRRSLIPVFYHGQELANIVSVGNLDGIIFNSDNDSVVKTTLRLLENQCPTCARFVVCSSKNEAAFRSWDGIPPTILKEDESPETWTDRIERAITLNQWLCKAEFRLILPRLRTIPSLPESHRQVVEALRNPDFEVDDVARLIGQDVAMTAQLLKIVNSAALGLAQPVHSIATAVGVLGVARLQSLVMSAWAFFFADEKMCRGFNPSAEWNHALAVAQIAEKIGKEQKAKPDLLEQAFIAGVLHDIGKLMLAANSPEAYADILALAEKQKQAVWQAEKEVLGYTHAEVGACVLGLWGLDLSIVEAVARHHDPALAAGDALSKLIYDANLESHAGESHNHPPTPQPRPR
jgi:putative nucleotidyltransferase with HDIG domain